MKIIFYLHHPAQFHLFKNIIKKTQLDNEVLVIATKKDILLNLLDDEKINYVNILPEGRNNNLFSIALGLLKQDYRLWKICRKFKPNLLVGTSTEITHIGRLMGIKSLFFIEDDIDVVPILNYLAHPFADRIITPVVCKLGKWEKKGVKYHGYQKLSYLHPNIFQPDFEIVKKYNLEEKYFILRLSNLGAHHDVNAKGISEDVLDKIIEKLQVHGQVLISSEGPLNDKYANYKLNIDPLDIHHILSYCSLFIGDSQSMAVENAILGTPNIRVSSFVNRISVLEELEHKYNLTFGVKPDNEKELLERIDEIISNDNNEAIYKERKQKLLSEKINVNDFILWYITNFPKSDLEFKSTPGFQTKFIQND